MEKLTVEVSPDKKTKLGVLKATSKSDFKQLIDEALELLFAKHNVSLR